MKWNLAFACFSFFVALAFCQEEPFQLNEGVEGELQLLPPPPQQESIDGNIILRAYENGGEIKFDDELPSSPPQQETIDGDLERRDDNTKKNKKKFGRGKKGFTKDQVRAAFKNLGSNDELETDAAKEVRNKKTGEVMGRFRLKHQNFVVWGGKSVVYKGNPEKGNMKPVRGLRKNLDKKTRGVNTGRQGNNLKQSIGKCLEYFNYAPESVEKTINATVWFDHDDTEDSAMLLCHLLTIDGTANNGEIYSISCLVGIKESKVFKAWRQFESIIYGGNLRTEAITYNSLPGTTASDGLCEMATSDSLLYVYDGKMTTSRDWRSLKPIRYDCNHGPSDAINGGYGVAADCIYNGANILQMFFDPNWGNFDSPDQVNELGRINIIAHFGTNYPNAFWSTSDAGFYAGDGGDKFHPLCSCVDVVGHEIGHALTSVRSKLIYAGESGCMNEAFSDMVGETAENYAYGSNDWLIARYCVKNGNGLRNMTTFKSYADYIPGASVHQCSGIYNSAFYRLATLNSHWNIQRAFSVFLAANSAGWTEDTGMVDGWCQVISAAYEISDGDATMDACDAYNVGKMHGMVCTDEDLQDILSSC